MLDLADRLNKQEQARPGEYKPGDKVNQALDALNQHQAAKPGDYVGRWDEQINGLLEQVLNRPAFNYDFNADPLYQQYKNQYVQQGKQAMQDTVAQASALTGGYGNSYAAAAGSGAYQQYLNQLNGVIPELYEAAYARYRGEGSDMMDKLGVLQGMDNTDYGRYRDKVSDWEAMLDYLTGRYDTERNFDYGTYRDKVSIGRACGTIWPGVTTQSGTLTTALGAIPWGIGKACATITRTSRTGRRNLTSSRRSGITKCSRTLRRVRRRCKRFPAAGKAAEMSSR